MQFNEIFNTTDDEMITLSICRAADTEILAQIFRLIDEKNITAHLVDDEKHLKDMISKLDKAYLSSPNIVLHHADGDIEAAEIAVSLAAAGTCNVLMKGMLSTSVILKEVLRKDHQLVSGNLLSHIALFDLPNYHKSILLSDSGMNIDPDIETMKSIINNAVGTAHQLKITHPKIALLSAVEKVNSRIAATVSAESLTSYYKNSNDFTVDGPLQYDLAVSAKAAVQKGFKSTVAGDADVLIVPDLNVGNILYKSLVYTGGARVAAMVTGAKVPIVLTSRSDSSEDKYHSICLAVYSINNKI
ncbi:phosphate acyltransferase [Corticicoccus populi]|uniref:Phosphate acyltransferase n=1 Tax=Corticicoccus populi TaxID=1812821 RepID=A0ABW5WTP8_9STAP